MAPARILDLVRFPPQRRRFTEEIQGWSEQLGSARVFYPVGLSHLMHEFANGDYRRLLEYLPDAVRAVEAPVGEHEPWSEQFSGSWPSCADETVVGFNDDQLRAGCHGKPVLLVKACVCIRAMEAYVAHCDPSIDIYDHVRIEAGVYQLVGFTPEYRRKVDPKKLAGFRDEAARLLTTDREDLEMIDLHMSIGRPVVFEIAELGRVHLNKDDNGMLQVRAARRNPQNIKQASDVLHFRPGRPVGALQPAAPEMRTST